MGSRVHVCVSGLLALFVLAFSVLVISPVEAVGGPTVDLGITGASEVSAWGDAVLTPTTMVPIATELPILLGFRTDRAALESRAVAVAEPSSSAYGDYRSVVENSITYNAPDEQVARVIDWFEARSVALTVDATHTFVSGSIPISVLEEMTGTSFGTYAFSGAPPGVVIVTPTTSVASLVEPLASDIDRVVGATTFWESSSNGPARIEPPRPDVSRSSTESIAQLQPADGGTPWRTGTQTDACPDAASQTAAGYAIGLSPEQLRHAYGIDRLWERGHRGAGARISIVDPAAYLPSDIAVWRACFGLEGTAVTDHLIGNPSFSPADSEETTLDIQTVISFAPDAERIDWFGVEPSGPGTIGEYIHMLAPPLDVSLTGGVATDVITLSYGTCEAWLRANDPGLRPGLSIFEQMVATGVASGIGTFVSTGDTGSTGCFPNGDGGDPDYTISPQFPGTSRWVTAVGGTNLTLDDRNDVMSSGVWNDLHFLTATPPLDTHIGSGTGGLSELSSRQPWQPRIGAGLHRPVPDISAFADELPGYFLYFDGQWATVGGTSASTPLIATSMALQSSVQTSRGGSRLGFVAPLLHSLANGSDPAAAEVIVDVTLGNNDAHDVGVYPAIEGYDMASGLGWIRQGELMAYLDQRTPDDPIAPAFTG